MRPSFLQRLFPLLAALLMAALSGLVHVPSALSSPAPSASPHPSPAPPPAGAASLTRPTSAVDTWTMSAGTAAGWAVGDHVRLARGGSAVADGVVIEVSAHSATLVLTKQARRPQVGDGVEFVRRRSPLPKDVPVSSVGPHPAMGGGVTVTAGGTAGTPTEWKELGTVPGLLGKDWQEKHTRYAQVYARKDDLRYLGEVVDMLDVSFEVNRDFMGVTPRTVPMRFYFFSLAEPAHMQPMFKDRLASRTRVMGVALYPSEDVVVNLGNWRTGAHFEPWEVEKVCRHEMNHLFMFRVRGSDRTGTWHWLGEALAHTIEDTVMPASSQLTLSELKTYMRGMSARDAGWQALIGDRDNDQLEQYRDYRQVLMSVVFYLRDKYGADAVRRLVVAAGQGRDIDDAFVEVTGKNVRDLEVDWRAYYGIR